MRIAQLADTAEVFLRRAGLEAAIATVAERSGTQFDPELAEIFCAHATELTAGLLELDPWPAVLLAAPHDTALSEQELDSVLGAIGDFADLKSPSTAGHSRAVAALAAAAAREYGLNTTQIAVLRRGRPGGGSSGTAGWLRLSARTQGCRA